ncbi:uncharacterized protein FA14DRAFT_173751 [Meira miltonrushii]|uniref:RanBP2-type domain-containing protein n=1 Tax=Meira miltonrushii TaxID=1280837 RepID=A0A316V963_9BASI|nr:uncharacterized protein FA14DRAFT_173751 [Meira miltonrushii]PWN34030.1 hypothetical protein FA14DRAFT_173751 [Meira miltonrushii]
MQVHEEIDQPIKLEYLSGHCENINGGGSMFDSNRSIPRTPASLPMKPQSDVVANMDTLSMEHDVQQALFLPALAMQHAAKLVASNPISNGSMQYPTSYSAPILTTSPASNMASAVKLASMGVQFGPGINPNISNPSSGAGNGNGTMQNNPPIVNTGNNGPMCVQPGDWVCSKCGFVNWRRRRVCMRCFPLADQSNEMSRSIVNGATVAAQLAAGVEPSADLVASLTAGRRPQNGSGSQTPLYNSISNPATPNPHMPARSNTLNALTPFKPSTSPIVSTSEYVDNTLSYSFQNATVSEPQQQWNPAQVSPFPSNQSSTFGQYNNSSAAFHSVQASPVHSPLVSRMYDSPQASRPELTRHAHSSSFLSSLNPYASNGFYNDHQFKQSTKSGGATPLEEDQTDLHDLWFKPKTATAKGASKSHTNNTGSSSPDLTRHNGNLLDNKSIFNLSSHFSPLQNKKIKIDEGESSMQGHHTNSTIYNGESSNAITVSAANETDEIVVPCANEKRYSFSNSGSTFKTSVFQLDKTGLGGVGGGNRMLPIGKAAIEPPSSISSASATANSSSSSLAITTATQNTSPKQHNRSTTPTPSSTTSRKE